MHATVAVILSRGDLWLAVALIASWLVFMSLKTVAADLDYAVRWHKLKTDAERLRQQQIKRLRELGLRGRNSA